MAATSRPFSLYVHIPYCIKKCPYCDFNVHVARVLPEREYIQALVQELVSYAESSDWRGRCLKSIFFGGGTPSMFASESIGRVIDEAARLFPFGDKIEISIEANPETEDCARFPGYRSKGVNRISIGAQSFQPRLLKTLGRLHTADETRRALVSALEAGFAIVSLDLIYAIPGQSLSELEEDLETALGSGVQHFSAYGLTFEEHTIFYRDLHAGKIAALPEETEVAMAELIEKMAAEHGFERYEISNYARPGFRSRHNRNYWKAGDYLGIGAGAHSYIQRDGTGAEWGCRWQNEKSPRRYMDAVGCMGRAACAHASLDMARAAGEYMFLGLRMTEGVSVDRFAQRFGQTFDEFYPVINQLFADGLLERSGTRLRLTPRGLLVANSVFVNFV
jgi:putative oxygen-independent coproporphyrinogen III oxidase